MSQFAQAIRSYRSGGFSRDQLLGEVDRQLGDHAASPDSLLAIFDGEHAAAPLPADLRQAIAQRIARWLQADTVVRVPPPVDDTKTIFLNSPGTVPEHAGHTAAVDVGSVLQGRFKLVEHVGEGGMSRVYKAIDLRRVEAHSQDPYVAVKVLTVPFTDYFASMQALHREAHKLQSLTHPNIVRVIDVDRDGQTVFMTMEFLAGRSLQRTLAAGMPRDAAEPIVTAIANALEFAHRNRIVHGDLKPGNVIITEKGEVKVIDFGIARFLARPLEGGSAEQNGDWENVEALTPPYASPEMSEGSEPDPRDDVYALACIAYELLTGEHPFDRAAGTVARDARMSVVRRGTMSTRQFKAIVRGLQFERARRTVSVQAFIDEFNGRPARVPTLALAAAALLGIGVLIALYMNRTQTVPAPIERAATLAPGQVFRDCPTCPLMRVLPGGTFVQGSTFQPAEQPLHEVTLKAPIAFAVREVTTGEFAEFADEANLPADACDAYDGEWRVREDVRWNTVDATYTALHPVSCVSWDDATAYTQWLSKKTGQSYRLPSASEWEYAASAGSSASVSLQAGDACKVANVADESAAQRFPGWDVLACDDRHAQAAPVGSYAANAFGLNDMLGNVFEWVHDCWSDTYAGAPVDGSASIQSDCRQREMRGGSWFTSPAYLRPSYRNRFEHEYRSTSVGFRVVRDLGPSPKRAT